MSEIKLDACRLAALRNVALALAKDEDNEHLLAAHRILATGDAAAENLQAKSDGNYENDMCAEPQHYAGCPALDGKPVCFCRKR